MDSFPQLSNNNNNNNNNGNTSNAMNSTLKVICLDLDETLIHATRVACNNTGNKQLKYWGQRVSYYRELEAKNLLKNKPVDCRLNDEEYLRATYGPPLFENNPDIASPFRWSFPTDDFSTCWILMRCHNQTHNITSFYRIEYRPYCQHLIEIINKYKKNCDVKVVISTMATRQYGLLACEGFKLFKGYFENINGVVTPFIDKFVGLEDWRENCWNCRYPAFYGKKSLEYIGSLFGINSSYIIAIDDKPQIWTNAKQVIYAFPYTGGLHLRQNKKIHKHHHQNETLTKECKLDDILYRIAKYFENYLCQTLNILSKQTKSPNNHKDNKNNENEQLLKKLQLRSNSVDNMNNNNDNDDNNNNHTSKLNNNSDNNSYCDRDDNYHNDNDIDMDLRRDYHNNMIHNDNNFDQNNNEEHETNILENNKERDHQKIFNSSSHNYIQVHMHSNNNINK